MVTSPNEWKIIDWNEKQTNLVLKMTTMVSKFRPVSRANRFWDDFDVFSRALLAAIRQKILKSDYNYGFEMFKI